MQEIFWIGRTPQFCGAGVECKRQKDEIFFCVFNWNALHNHYIDNDFYFSCKEWKKLLRL